MLTNLSRAGLKLEVARDTNRHVRKTLPPSLTGLSGVAEIQYYVKATVARPQFYKENIRAVRELRHSQPMCSREIINPSAVFRFQLSSDRAAKISQPQ
jgi:hypothetical protein